MVRPQDLKLPYEINETSKKAPIIFHDHFWSVPPWVDLKTFSFPGWDQLFNRKAPVVVEYCSGHGHWIVELAKQHPEFNWLAVEKRFDRAKKIWSKIKNNGLINCIVACAEGGQLTSGYFPNGSIEQVYINFPDPWPKTRHAKHRIMSNPFLDEMKRVLTPSGTVTFVTDDEDYSKIFFKIMGKRTDFSHLIPEPHFGPLPDDYGISFFEEIFREMGKVNRFHKIGKR